MNDIQTLAQSFLSFFVRRQRSSGEVITCLEDNASGALRELVHAAHQEAGMLPDDFRYGCIVDVLEAFANNEDTESALEELRTDLNISELTAWLHSHVYRIHYLTEALEGTWDSGFALLVAAQKIEREEVFRSVLESLESILEEEDLEDDLTG